MRKLDVRRLISDLGGAESVVEGLRTIGVDDISAKGVEKWRERGSIPMERWIELVEMERKNNRRSLVLDDYYLRGDKDAKSSRAV